MQLSIAKYSARLINGEKISLDQYQGNVLLIVNTATECGFTPQLKSLQALHEQYINRGFTILAFPCNQFGNQEPGTNSEIAQVCEKNYSVSFPLFEKIKVKGPQAHPLFQYLTKQTKGIMSSKIKWNFTKFLINRQGKVVDRFAPITKPDKIRTKIEALL